MNSKNTQVSSPDARRMAALEEVSAGAITIVGAPLDPEPGYRSSTALGPNALRSAIKDVLNVFWSSPSGAIEDLDTGLSVFLDQASSIVDIGDLASPLESDALNYVCRLIDSPGAIPVVLGGSRELGGACVASVAGLETNAAFVHVSPTIVPGDCFVGMNTCFLGTNGLVPERLWQEAVSADATIIRAGQIYESGVESAVVTLEAFLRDQQAVFWHIDAAVIDSGHAAGTPNLNIGGLSPKQLIATLEGVAEESRVVGCVVTNVAPTFDKRGLSEFVAAEALVRVLSPRLVSTADQKCHN